MKSRIPAILSNKSRFNKEIRLIHPICPNKEEMNNEIIPKLNDIFERGWLSNDGRYTLELEAETSNYLNTNCIAVCNGTIGLLLAIKALNLKGNVILPSFTFPATAHVLEFMDIEPRFVDIDSETYNINPELIEEKIDDNTSAILGVHVFGNPCEIYKLNNVAKENNLKLLFDSAHAFGAEYNKKRVGCFGNVEMFSTHATKTFITAEGGLLASNNKEFISDIKELRNFGFKENLEDHDTHKPGINAKMSELNAILGLYSFKKFSEALKIKRKIANIYNKELSNTEGINLQKTTKNSKHSYLFYSILLNKDFRITRDQLFEALKKENIITRKYFYKPLHLHKTYSRKDRLEATEKISDNILCIPIHANLTEDIAYEICDIISNIQKHSDKIKTIKT